jgi:hypothetical protein
VAFHGSSLLYPFYLSAASEQRPSLSAASHHLWSKALGLLVSKDVIPPEIPQDSLLRMSDLGSLAGLLSNTQLPHSIKCAISSIGLSHPECTYNNLPSQGRWCSCFWATYQTGLLPGLLTYSDLTSSFCAEHQSGSPWPVIPATDTNYGGHRRRSSGQRTGKKALPDKLERSQLWPNT